MDYTEKLIRHVNGYHGLITETTLDTVALPNGGEAYRDPFDPEEIAERIVGHSLPSHPDEVRD